MKSLLIVTEAFEVGGLETHIRGEIVSLSRAGCSVHLATGKRFNPLLLPPETASLTTHLPFGPETTLTELSHAVEALRHIIRQHAIKCVHAHPFTSLLPAYIAAEFEKIPFVLTLHGPASLGSFYGPLYDFILTSILLPHAALVVTVSEEISELASPYVAQEQIFTLPNGIDIDTFSTKIPSTDTDPRWLLVSRLDSFKVAGIADFIAKAKAAGLPGVLLAGDGPSKETLINQLAHADILNIVEFCGARADIPQLMQSVAGVAGMGRVVLEGLASHKPVCLVGYDGVKGVVNSTSFFQASLTNFSGRNLENIDETTFINQIKNLPHIPVTALYDTVREQFIETRLWKSFLDKIGTLEPITPTLLGHCYRALTVNPISENMPFLQSPIFLEQMGKLAHSPNYYRADLVARFLFHKDQFINDTHQKAFAEFNTQIAHLHQSITQQEKQIANLLAEVAERDKHISDLKHTVADKEKLLKELQMMQSLEREETLRLSDWAQKMDTYPFRYGTKKYLLKFAKACYRTLPLNLATKHKLKTNLVKLLHLKSSNRAVPFHSIYPISPSDIKSLTANLAALIEGGCVNSRQDYFIFSVIDWHFRIQRPQHLAKYLARTGRRVFFFSNHFIDSTRSGYAIERLDPLHELYQIKLHVAGAPAIYFAPPSARHFAMIEQGMAKFLMDFAAISSVSLVQHAYWYSLAVRLPNTLRVYDCMDHHEGFGNVPEKLIETEKKMLQESDLVVITSTWLENYARNYNPNCVVIRNASEFEHFANPPPKHYSDTKGRKIIGYYGAIAEWFDLDLIRAIAQAEPTILILLVGNDTIKAAEAVKTIPNIVFIGEVPYARLPYYLHAFDVCLLPFLISPLTLATNPVKVYEYLAAGKPIVCTDLPEISQFGSMVHRAADRDEFIRKVSDCLRSADNESIHQQRRQFAREQTWDHRVNALTEAIRMIPLPKISIVVLTYNNLVLTKPCLNSLLRWSDYPNIEIIVVDNASTDGTPDYLRELQQRTMHVRLILNDKNHGFAKGNNIGLQAASGDYLVLLNNDTIVTPGWLLTMLRHLQADPTIGLIGSVTNNIGNEAKIDIAYNGQEDMLPVALAYTVAHMGQHMPLRTAAFFCVMFPRKVFEEVGLLDENFGRGFFEDDDYCRRIERLGLRIVCAEDVFIHHHLSASFNKIHDAERQALFKKNKTYYESKWGKWEPHEYR